MQQASLGNNDKANHLSVDISELIREAYEVVQRFPAFVASVMWAFQLIKLTAPFQKYGNIRSEEVESSRKKNKLHVIQTLEDTTKQNVVSGVWGEINKGVLVVCGPAAINNLTRRSSTCTTASLITSRLSLQLADIEHTNMSLKTAFFFRQRGGSKQP